MGFAHQRSCAQERLQLTETGLSLRPAKGRDPRVAQFGSQVIAQQMGLDSIECLVQLLDVDLEEKPSMIAPRQMIVL